MRHLVLIPVYLYRWCLSPFLPPSCRYLPTCSEYSLEAVQRHGVWFGTWLALKRIGRCHPFESLGAKHGYDPVPVEISGGAWYAPWTVKATHASVEKRKTRAHD